VPSIGSVYSIQVVLMVTWKKAALDPLCRYCEFLAMDRLTMLGALSRSGALLMELVMW